MVMTDIFSSSFLFSIGIIIILIGGIFAYVSYRMGEQDHKLNSMIGLISTMAEESRFFRSKIATLQQKLNSSDLPIVDKLQYSSQMMGGQEELIDVSDGNETDGNETDSGVGETDSGSEEDDVSDDGSDDEDEDEAGQRANIKMLNLSLANDDNNNEIPDTFDIEQLPEFKEDIKTIHLDLEDPLTLEEADITEQLDEPKISEEDMTFLKNVSITDLGEENANNVEYKKMTINKLRELVVSKGLVSDASKLKKNDILKLLDNE
jgi:hypothetical protein